MNLLWPLSITALAVFTIWAIRAEFCGPWKRCAACSREYNKWTTRIKPDSDAELSGTCQDCEREIKRLEELRDLEGLE